MNIKQYLIAVLPLLGFVSCSEEDTTEQEYANWQAKNEAFFETQYQAHSVQTDNCFILPSWTQPGSKKATELSHTNCILVDVLERGTGMTSPYYTDSVNVDWSGRLMPSPSYDNGYEFGRSWLTKFDPDVDQPSAFAVKGLVAGFSTALQHMHRGDRWRVYIPYQLGYGSTATSGIPAYSTLIYEIRLVDFWFKKSGDRK